MDVTYIDRAVRSLLAEDPTLTVLDSGDLLTEAYLDTALEALAQSLSTMVGASVARALW